MKSTLLVLFGMACVAGGVVGAGRTTSDRAQTRPVATPSAASGTFVIDDVRVFDGEKMLPRGAVFVRDGRIAEVGATVMRPAGAVVISGSGRTLLPGFIDAHTHAFGDALERALVFGVTTELDMFTDHRQAAQWRAGQRGAGAPGRADIFSAGTLITAPKGHGTQFGMAIPTITAPTDAQAFVDARIAEGSDYIKIVYEAGSSYGLKLASLTPEILRAVITAAHSRGKLAVVHVGSRRDAEEAIASGADGLVHIFGEEPPPSGFAAAVRKAGAFVIPTLSVIESVSGVAGSAPVGSTPALAPYLTGAERTSLSASFPQRPGNKVTLVHALEVTRALHAAGVVLLAGSDAPNPGTAHGITIHREMELLVAAGLTPVGALAAATSAPARAFRIDDRGRIVAGMRADLVLVEGDPSADIKATRNIVAVWKGGVSLDRKAAPKDDKPAETVTSGAISDFDDGEVSAGFGAGWQVSTDAMMGGGSEAAMKVVRPGAGGSAAALEIAGAIKPGAPFSWAGAMFFPAATPMAPANLSKFKEVVFWARGDGREYQVMMFATRLGDVPAAQPFTAGPEWREYVMPLKAFSGIDGSDLRGILFSANTAPGPFRFSIDSIRLR